VVVKRPVCSSLAVAALALGCDRPAKPTGGGDAASAVATSERASPSLGSLDARAVAALREASVTDASFARRVLFSWTTQEQAEALRRDKLLLLGTELPSGPTPYVELLEHQASGQGPYAEVARLLLFHPSLKLRRYAWTRPWPTRMGLADRAYGDVLVRVVLAPNAILARFDPSRPDVFELHDLDERQVTIGELLAKPSRLAAVYHVRTKGATPIAHREYVLCNESMIAEWSLATPAIAQAVAEDRALLAALAQSPPPNAPAAVHWKAGGDDVLYATALAFDNDRYRSTAENLRAIESALGKADGSGPPLVHAPTAKFDEGATIPNVAVRRRVKRIIPTAV
jgi:hypothetical protein